MGKGTQAPGPAALPSSGQTLGGLTGDVLAEKEQRNTHWSQLPVLGPRLCLEVVERHYHPYLFRR